MSRNPSANRVREANRMGCELSSSYRTSLLHNSGVGPVILQPFWSEANHVHRASSAAPRLLRGDAPARRTVGSFSTRCSVLRHSSRKETKVSSGSTLHTAGRRSLTMSRSMGSSRTQNCHCCTTLLTGRAAALVIVSRTILMTPLV